jgi:DNA-binding response OmpR family regulator
VFTESVFTGQPAALAAEDDPDTRELITTILESAGISTHSVPTGHAALHAITSTGLPRLLVLDVRMPGPNGLEICARAKHLAHTQGGTVAVLLLSAEDSPADLAAGYAAGADDYLTKPFHPTDLAHRATTLLATIHEASRS